MIPEAEMKKTVLIASLLLTAASLFARGADEPVGGSTAAGEPVVLKFITPAGFPAISLADMIADTPVFAGNVSVEYEVVNSPDLIAGKILTGEADMILAPTNLGAALYNKGEDIVLAGSAVWGLLYVVTTEDIGGWDDLRGREVAMFARGLTPDIVFRYLLGAAGLVPGEDVALSYVQNTAELGPMFISGRTTLALLPEPVLTIVRSKVPEARVVLDLQKEWAAASGTSESYPQASLFVRKAVAEGHREFLDSFLAEYEASIGRILADPEVAGVKASSFLDSPPAPVIAASIPGGNLAWASAPEARPSVEEYLGVLLDYAPGTIGGALPDDGFYLE